MLEEMEGLRKKEVAIMPVELPFILWEVPLRRCGSSTNAEGFMAPLFICSISVYYHVFKLPCSWVGGFMDYII